MASASDPIRQLLRHMVATVAYRGGKTLREAPPTFATFRAAETTRTPLELVAHLSDLGEDEGGNGGEEAVPEGDAPAGDGGK